MGARRLHRGEPSEGHSALPAGTGLSLEARLELRGGGGPSASASASAPASAQHRHSPYTACLSVCSPDQE